MFHFSRFTFPIFLFSIFYFLFSGVALAEGERVYFRAPETVSLGSQFPVEILVDSDQPLNAYSLEISFPADFLEVVSFDNSRSIINISADQPTISARGAVRFKGGSVVPFSGRAGNILSINLRAIGIGTAKLSLNQVSLYLANGKGTRIVPATENSDVKISVSVSGQISQGAPREDTVPPKINFLSIVRDPFNNEHKLIGFFVSDDISGVKEVLVRARSFLFWSDWLPARNPTAVSKNTWVVELRVTDNFGNIAEQTIYDWGALARLVAVWGSAVAAVLIVWYFMRRRRTRGAVKHEGSQ